MTELEEFTYEVHNLLSDRYGPEADLIASVAGFGKIGIYFNNKAYILTVSEIDQSASAYEMLTRLTAE